MTGASQNQIAAQLQTQLEKLRSADPFRTLDVAPQVDAEGVRRAYLTLTKKFHPNRFALEPGPTRDLANEVFLLIRRAYDLLVDDEKRKQWRDRVAPTPAPMATPAKVATVPSSTAKVATVPASVPPNTRPATSQASPPPATTVRPTGTIPTAPAGSRPPVPTPARTTTLPGSTSPPGPTTRRPMGPASTGVTGASPQEVQAMLEAARTRGQRFDDAVALIGRGKYKDAREAFYKIAMEDPQSKRYRIQLHYAWGLEHLADGKPAEAHRELERALALEPESTDIKAAIARVKELEKDKKPGGILGKLFGR